MAIFEKFSSRNFDWPLAAVAFLLAAVGLTAIYSVDLSRGEALVYFEKQVVVLGFGLFLFFAASAVQYTFFRNYAKWWYFLSVILLIAVLIFGSRIRGTTGWFSFGGFSFQPAEFAKVGLILMLAYIAAGFGRRFDRPLFFLGTAAVTLIQVVLILFQPDLGSAVLIGAIWFGLMCLLGVKKRRLLTAVGVVLVVGVMAWIFFLQGYQKERLLNFVDPGRDPLGSGYNVIQSVIAVGSGQWYGRGLGFGSQSQLRFLPETQTDFVFSVIGEELGLGGVILLLGLYALLFWRLFLVLKNANHDFVAVVAGGTIILFFVQIFVNIGSSVGLLPVTGVTLPFVSYGGSSMAVNFLLLGIAESLRRKR